MWRRSNRNISHFSRSAYARSQKKICSLQPFTAYLPRLASVLAPDFVFKEQLSVELNGRQSFCTRREDPQTQDVNQHSIAEDIKRQSRPNSCCPYIEYPMKRSRPENQAKILSTIFPWPFSTKAIGLPLDLKFSSSCLSPNWLRSVAWKSC